MEDSMTGRSWYIIFSAAGHQFRMSEEGKERVRSYDKTVPDSRGKPEGSRTKAQRRKPPSAKALESEGCWSLSKLDYYLHRMRPSGTRARARFGERQRWFSRGRLAPPWSYSLESKVRVDIMPARPFKRTHCPRNSVCTVNYGLGQRTSSCSRLRLPQAHWDAPYDLMRETKQEIES